MARILVVDDEASQRDLLGGILGKEGHEVLAAESGERGLELAQRGVDLALVDLRLPGMDGIETLEKLKELDPSLEVVIVTAYGSVQTAVSAMKRGASDYITKPVDVEELLLLIDRALKRRDLETEVRFLKEELDRVQGGPEIIAESPAMKEVMSLVYRVAQSKATVLVTGESGTGKELISRALHLGSDRKDKRFVALSCSALPENLIESELFGHERGAFTGAVASKPGKLELADQGTLFLDEIGDLSLPVQVKLLRVLQTMEFERLGSNRTIHADVRVVAATNQDLEARIEAKEFREDLYYRLHVVSIHIPPLRDRREDILPGAGHFLRRYAAELGKPVRGFTKEARDALLGYDWPGNLRELENMVERAVVLTRRDLIEPEDLALHRESGGEPSSLRLDDLEARHIERVLRMTGGNMGQAADVMGIHRNTLREKIRRYGIGTEGNSSSK
jgi:DNA-binding NtrC family response regulator